MKIRKIQQSSGVVANVAQTKTNSDTDTYSCNYINNLVKTVEVYNDTVWLNSGNADTYNVLNVSPVNGTVLMYFITECWPLENWSYGALVQIGRMFTETNKVTLKTTSAQQYIIKISALYIPN